MLIAIAVFCAIIATRKYLLAPGTLQVNAMMPNPLKVHRFEFPQSVALRLIWSCSRKWIWWVRLVCSAQSGGSLTAQECAGRAHADGPGTFPSARRRLHTPDCLLDCKADTRHQEPEGIAGCKPRRNASSNPISEIQGVGLHRFLSQGGGALHPLPFRLILEATQAEFLQQARDVVWMPADNLGHPVTVSLGFFEGFEQTAAHRLPRGTVESFLVEEWIVF